MIFTKKVEGVRAIQAIKYKKKGWKVSSCMRTFGEEEHKSNCPFRGCAGDWVKLGVAKRHGAVLGDAVSKMADENTKVSSAS